MVRLRDGGLSTAAFVHQAVLESRHTSGVVPEQVQSTVLRSEWLVLLVVTAEVPEEVQPAVREAIKAGRAGVATAPAVLPKVVTYSN